MYQRGQFSTRSVDLHDMRMLGANAETAARTDLRSSVGRAAHRVAQRAIPRAETVLLVPVSLPLGVLPPRPHNWLRRAIPLHVTLLYPFVPPGALNGDIVAAVEGVLRGHHAFSFSLTGVRSFTNARYFVIEPQQPFVELIGDCQRAWPEYPRYGGEFSTIIPHVTIAQGRRMNRVDPGIEARLPVQVAARHVEIWRNDVIRGWVRHSLLELPRER